jgi:hypothetical protein
VVPMDSVVVDEKASGETRLDLDSSVKMSRGILVYSSSTNVLK